MQVPSRVELERFCGEGWVEEIRLLEAVAAWPSLRVPKFLYANEPATTGDIARGINMDMREVKGRLDPPKEQGVLAQDEDDWRTRTDRIEMTIRRVGSRLEVLHTTETSPGPSETSLEGILTRLGRHLNPFG